MMIGSQMMPDKISAAATARLDREFAGWDRKHWLRELAGKIRLAVIWQIPVGFEDETGFHLGVQQIPENDRLDEGRERIFAEDEHF